MIEQGGKETTLPRSLYFFTLASSSHVKTPPPPAASLAFFGPWSPQAGLGHCKTYFVLSHKLNAGSKIPVTGLD